MLLPRVIGIINVARRPQIGRRSENDHFDWGKEHLEDAEHDPPRNSIPPERAGNVPLVAIAVLKIQVDNVSALLREEFVTFAFSSNL